MNSSSALILLIPVCTCSHIPPASNDSNLAHLPVLTHLAPGEEHVYTCPCACEGSVMCWYKEGTRAHPFVLRRSEESIEFSYSNCSVPMTPNVTVTGSSEINGVLFFCVSTSANGSHCPVQLSIGPRPMRTILNETVTSSTMVTVTG